MILPSLPLIAESQYGASEFQAALLSSAYYAAMFLAAPFLGRLSDRLGRRPVLMVSQLGTILSFIMFIFARQLGDLMGINIGISAGLFVFFLARILDGFTGGNISTAQAYVSDVSTPENRTQALGMLSAGFGLGFIFGPALGGILGGINTAAPFIGAALVTTVTFLLTTFMLKESLTPERRSAAREKQPQITFWEAIANRDFLLILVLGFIQILAFSAIPPTFSLYADRVLFPDITNPERVTLYVGIMLSFMGFFNVIVQMWLIKPLAARFGEKNLVAIGQTVFMATMFILPLSGNPIIVTLFFIPFALGRGISDPSLQSLVTRFGTDRTRGRLLGIYQSALSMGFVFGPIWSGWVFENVSPRLVYPIGGVIVIPAVILSYILRGRKLSPNIKN